MPSKDDVVAPEGWNWDQEWEIDLNRAVDDEGKVNICFISATILK